MTETGKKENLDKTLNCEQEEELEKERTKAILEERANIGKKWFEEMLPICLKYDEEYNKPEDVLYYSKCFMKIGALEPNEIMHIKEYLKFKDKRFVMHVGVFYDKHAKRNECWVESIEVQDPCSPKFIMTELVPKVFKCFDESNCILFAKIVPKMLELVAHVLKKENEIGPDGILKQEVRSKEEIEKDILQQSGQVDENLIKEATEIIMNKKDILHSA